MVGEFIVVGIVIIVALFLILMVTHPGVFLIRSLIKLGTAIAKAIGAIFSGKKNKNN